MRTLFQTSRGLTSSFFRAFSVLLLLLASAFAARADGCYIPHKTYLQTPTIPAQTAIISFRDGQEILVVQSLLQAEGQEFGWIIPVPASPTEMRVGTPGMIKTLQVQLQPEIHMDDVKGSFDFTQKILLTLYVTIICLWVIKRTPTFRRGIVNGLAVFFVFLLLPMTVLQSLGGKMTSYQSVAGVDLSQSSVVGNYDVAVLKAQTVENLNDWLARNNLRAFDATSSQVVQSYIRENWSFVLARLQREKGGLSAPHPLVLTFPAKEPIYPMRLTALTEHSVALELFLIADRQYQSRDLAMEYSDQFFSRLSNLSIYSHHALFNTFRTPDEKEIEWPIYYGRNFQGMVGHELGRRLMWEGCIVTKLVGEVRPAAMSHDFTFLSMPEGKPYRLQVYSKGMAAREGFALGATIWCMGLIAFIARYLKTIYASTHYAFINQSLLLLAAISILVGVGKYLTCRQAAIRDEGNVYQVQNLEYYNQLKIQTHLAESPALNQGGLVQKLISDLERADLSNPYLGGKITNEDSPGNFEVIEQAGKIVVRLYREDGSYIEVTRPDPVPKDPRF